MNAISREQYRHAMGRFATGVTIVTTADSAGDPVGMTVNSFSSVSLEPPLVLWSVGQQSPEYEAFCQCRYFAIHVLNDQQQQLSNRFATPGEDKFAALDTREMKVDGQSVGVPLLADMMASLHCRIEQNHAAGDHNILVGRVLSVNVAAESDKQHYAPLLYFAGDYGRIAR